MVVEAAPGFASGEVGDDAVGAVAGGVGDAGEASYAVIVLGPDGEVEADIVQVGVQAGYLGGKDDGLDDLVGGEIEATSLGPLGWCAPTPGNYAQTDAASSAAPTSTSARAASFVNERPFP